MTPEQIDKLRLIRSTNIGPVSYMQLIGRFGSARLALEALPKLAERGGRAIKLAPMTEIERELKRAKAIGAHHLFLGEGEYPALLAETETAPPVLLYKGRLELLTKRIVAMVGARNASAAAIRFAHSLSGDLGREDLVVVSGLARGIDTAAHQGALTTGTIGVIACGLDIIFPPENAKLQAQIAEQGLVLSEHPPGNEPLARHFPARNRIIAGLASGTVVVEAAPRSGSLITARLASEEGREVMAVPGSPLDPRAQGCNKLIREGATLVQNAQDVLEALRPLGLKPMLYQPLPAYVPPQIAYQDTDDASRAHIISLLSPVAVPMDDLVRLSDYSLAQVQIILLELELAGRLSRHPGGKVALES
jgi:DNA processing protein